MWWHQCYRTALWLTYFGRTSDALRCAILVHVPISFATIVVERASFLQWLSCGVGIRPDTRFQEVKRSPWENSAANFVSTTQNKQAIKSPKLTQKSKLKICVIQNFKDLSVGSRRNSWNHGLRPVNPWGYGDWEYGEPFCKHWSSEVVHILNLDKGIQGMFLI